jgi:hypothetical protein
MGAFAQEYWQTPDDDVERWLQKHASRERDEKAFFVFVISASVLGDWLESGKKSVGLVNHY